MILFGRYHLTNYIINNDPQAIAIEDKPVALEVI